MSIAIAKQIDTTDLQLIDNRLTNMVFALKSFTGNMGDDASEFMIYESCKNSNILGVFQGEKQVEGAYRRFCDQLAIEINESPNYGSTEVSTATIEPVKPYKFSNLGLRLNVLEFRSVRTGLLGKSRVLVVKED